MKDPTRNEDAKNLSLVTGTGLLALLITAGLVWGSTKVPHDVIVTEVVNVRPVVVTVETEVEEPVAVHSGSDRLYGHVLTRNGNLYEGFIRWDRNEGSWADLLDATKADRLAGIRFGHVQRIEVTGRKSATFTLKSGEQVELGANATDLGTGLRALVVEDRQGGLAEFGWRDLSVIEFEEAPSEARLKDTRLYGTMQTTSGLAFTGYIAWDVDEIYSSDVLDGHDGKRDREIPFGEIEAIARNGSRGASVTLKNGQELTLRGTNDVNSSNGGISVSDPALGQVKVRWQDFGSVHFEAAPPQAGYDAFDGGRHLEGVVVTRDGDEYRGAVRWDRDEQSSWEMLNGKIRGVEFHIEFGKIASITKTPRGAMVTLNDGRSFELGDSNDVDSGNQGIEIERDGQTWRVRWSDFAELRLQ